MPNGFVLMRLELYTRYTHYINEILNYRTPQNCINSFIQRLNYPINIVLYKEIAPPINPLACTNSISLIWDISTNFSISLIPLHCYLSPFLNSNPYVSETVWILQLFPFLFGKITNKIYPLQFFYSSISRTDFGHGTYFYRTIILPDAWYFFLFSKAYSTMDFVCKVPLYYKKIITKTFV